MIKLFPFALSPNLMEAPIIPWVSLALKNRERPNMDIAVCSLSQLTSFYSVLCSGKVFRIAQVGTAARALKSIILLGQNVPLQPPL
jgi:hypothetical protein